MQIIKIMVKVSIGLHTIKGSIHMLNIFSYLM